MICASFFPDPWKDRGRQVWDVVSGSDNRLVMSVIYCMGDYLCFSTLVPEFVCPSVPRKNSLSLAFLFYLIHA